MADLIQIYNMALARVGHTKRVASISEASAAREICELFYEECRLNMLRSFPWRFAKMRRALTLLDGDPPVQWAYQYTKPSDCLRIRYIESPMGRHPRSELRVNYELACAEVQSGEDGTTTQDVIYCDLEDAVLVYNKDISDPTKFDPHFTSALGWYLASEIAIPMKADPKIASYALEMYYRTVREAAAASLNEAHESQPECEFLGARNG